MQPVDRYEVECIIAGLIEEEQIKRKMIMPSYTIANPKAMMVISLNTDLTFLAMLCTVLTFYTAFTTT